MAKVCGRACGVLCIFLIIIYNSNKCAVNALNERASYYDYDTSASSLTHIDAEFEPLEQLSKLRTRRDTSSTDATTQYKSVPQNGSATAAAAAAVEAAAAAAATVNGTATSGAEAIASGGLVPYNVHNVGVNGTGQRKNISLSVGGGGETTITVDENGATDAKKQGQTQFPKKVAATFGTPTTMIQQPNASVAGLNVAAAAASAAVSDPGAAPDATSTEKTIFEEVDITEDEAENEAKQHNMTIKEDHHIYYNSSMMVNKEATNRIWNTVKNISHNLMLSQSHRRAMTVELSFNFPFYGHFVKNITIATGGFIYTGEYVHSWLAATQYIAPLMANFDTSISNDSFVRMNDNGTAFTVVWENVVLQDKPTYGNFTFSATLHKNGDIVFTYFSVPIMIKSIQDNQHPVKVGLSDAYIIDKYYYFARRKTIYEYHRVSFSQKEISNGTIIYLTALPSCLGYTECNACIKHTTTFECVWCPQLNRCSTGTDRKKQEWIQKGCERALINDVANCPAIGQKGNNAGSQSANGGGSGGSNDNGSGNTSPSEATHTPLSGGGGGSADGSATTSAPSASSTGSPAHELPAGQEHRAMGPEHAAAPESKSVGVAFGFLVPICLVFAVTLWLFYAYRNPHTRSGQLLIQFRPSQWSWRRGEARYTAATIHM